MSSILFRLPLLDPVSVPGGTGLPNSAIGCHASRPEAHRGGVFWCISGLSDSQDRSGHYFHGYYFIFRVFGIYFLHFNGPLCRIRSLRTECLKLGFHNVRSKFLKLCFLFAASSLQFSFTIKVLLNSIMQFHSISSNSSSFHSPVTSSSWQRQYQWFWWQLQQADHTTCLGVVLGYFWA